MELFTKDSDWANYPGRQRKLITTVFGHLLVLVRPGLLFASPLASLHTESATLKKLHYSSPTPAATSSVCDLEVLEMELSIDGRYLALRCLHSVTVLSIPSILGKDMHLKSAVSVGEFEIGTDIHNPVVKVLWHPMSKTYSHLAVVMQNGVVRMYDLQLNTQKPESIFRLHMQESPRKGFHMPADLEVVSASFGFNYQGQQQQKSPAVLTGWLPMTLFCLLRNGDVMSLCPVLPRNGQITRQHADQLLFKCQEQLASISKTRINSLAYEKVLYKQRLDFIQTLISTSIPADPKNSHLLHFSAPKMSNYVADMRHEFSLYPQGPYRLIPTPSSSLDQAVEAHDLRFSFSTAVSRLSQQNSSSLLGFQIPFLSISYVGGLVDVCIVDVDQLAFGPTWQGSAQYLSSFDGETIGGTGENDDDEFEYLPALWVLESVDLNENSLFNESKVQLTSFASNPELLFAFHDNGLHYLDLTLASQLVSTCFTSSGPESDDALIALSKTLGKKNVVTVGGVLSTRQHVEQPSVTVQSAALWPDAILMPKLYLTTSSDDFTVVNLENLNKIRYRRLQSTSVPGKPSKNELKSTADKEILLRQLNIEKELPFIIRNKSHVEVGAVIPDFGTIVLPPNEASAKYPDGVSKKNYEIIARETLKLRDTMMQLQEYMASLEHRVKLIEQQKEILENELKNNSSTSGTEHSQEIEDRLKAAVARQALLTKRIDICANIAMEYSQPTLTQAEIEWAEELNAHLRSFSQLKSRLAQAKEMVKLLKAPTNTSSNNTPTKQTDGQDGNKSSWNGSYQLRNITNIIEKESVFIQDLRDKMKDVESKVDMLSLYE